MHDRDADGNGVFDEAGSIRTVRLSLDEAGAEVLGQPTGSVPQIAVSGDGRYVAFSYDVPLVASDTNGRADIYIVDRDSDGDGIFDETGAMKTVRVTDGMDGASTDPMLDRSGRFVVFESGSRKRRFGGAGSEWTRCAPARDDSIEWRRASCVRWA